MRMTGVEHTLLILLLILFVGLVVPRLIKPLRIPWVTTVILAGALIGPNGLGLVEQDPTIEFFGFLGFTFLMFMAGLETTGEAKANWKKVSGLAFANALIPFVTGVGVTLAFGYGWTSALLVGALFISSSVAIVIPSVKAVKSLAPDVKQLMISSVVIEDILSLVVLAVIFQVTAPVTQLPLWLYFIILTASIALLFYALPKIERFVLKKKKLFRHDDTESQMRFVIVTLIAILLYFSGLGVHPILAAFLVGMLVAQVLTSKKVYEHFHTLSYGLFIPVFFFIAGMNMNFGVFTQIDIGNLVVLGIIASLLLSKILSGYIGGRIAGFEGHSAFVFGVVSTTQLTTTLAAAFTAHSLGLIDDLLFTSVTILSIVTTIIVPLLFHRLFERTQK